MNMNECKVQYFVRYSDVGVTYNILSPTSVFLGRRIESVCALRTAREVTVDGQ